MTPTRRTAALVATATTTALVLSAQAAPSASAAPSDDRRVDRRGASLAERVARPSLRGSLTDTNFYFVMADRFNNGDTGNDEGGYTGDRTQTGFDPDQQALLPRR